MRFLTITNLYPRADYPQYGLFNYQLFQSLGELLCDEQGVSGNTLVNICPIPTWMMWRWSKIRKWKCPDIYDPQSTIHTIYLPVLYIPVFGRALSWWFYVNALRKKTSEMTKVGSDIDVVLASWLYPDGVAAMKLASELKKTGWLLVLGSDIAHLKSPVRRKMILKACHDARGIFCVAEHLKDALVSAGVNGAKINTVDNGVDERIFLYRAREKALSKLKTTNSQICQQIQHNYVVLFVGNLVAVKNVELLIDTFAGVIAQVDSKPMRPNNSHTSVITNSPVLLIIGDGPERKNLKQRVEKTGLIDKVYFLGTKPHQEVAYWMNVANCLCLCSSSEGMPNVLIEALTSGLPAVTTDVGICKQMLRDEPYSRIVPFDDVATLTRAVMEILEMNVDRKAMASRYQGKYSWKKMATTILGSIRTQ